MPVRRPERCTVESQGPSIVMTAEVVGSRETAAFTLRTQPPVDPVGAATAIRQAVQRHDDDGPSGIEELARRSRTTPAM